MSNILHATVALRSPLFWLVSLVTLASTFVPSAAHADRFDSQLYKLRQKNNHSQQAASALQAETSTLAGKVAALRSEMAALQAQINGTQSKVAQVQADIAKAEAELAQQRAVLAANVHQMYVDDDVSTLEMLASSKNLSDFVDQSQYHKSVGLKVQNTVNNIKDLKKQLDSQKQGLEQMLADQQAMKDRVGAVAAETNRLLQLKVNQQAAYTGNIAANNALAARLRAQQAAENTKGFIGRPSRFSLTGRAPTSGLVYKGGGSYPWAGVPFPNSMPDPWGMYKRQCVSYTAWKVASTGRHMPYWGGRGNAKQWDDNARSAGIPVSSAPRAGDVAISNAGAYGHAMYVEAVNGDGTIYISQYNAGWDGRYSEGRRSAAGLSYIHF